MTPSPIYIRTPCGPFDGRRFPELEFLGHASVEAYDTDAGVPGACLEDADRSQVHRETIQRFDKSFSEFVLALTGIPRGVNEKQTELERARVKGGTKPIPESFPRYMVRVFARVDEEMQATIAKEALAQSRLFRISSAPAIRLSPIENKFLLRAQSILSQDVSEINDRLAELLSITGDFPLGRDSDGKPELESMARLMQHASNIVLTRND